MPLLDQRSYLSACWRNEESCPGKALESFSIAAWSIPKGEYEEDEDPFEAAKREYREETGFEVVEGDYLELGELKQFGGKRITAWTVEGDCDPALFRSNTFSMEWPPRSGKQSEFPEVDKADWFSVAIAREELHKGQVGFVDRLCEILSADPP